MHDNAEPPLEPVFIAADVPEAERVEQLLAREGIDFEIRPEAFLHRAVDGTCLQGLLFEVPAAQAQHCRHLLASIGMLRGVVPSSSDQSVAGHDQVGRCVHLAFAREFAEIQKLGFPQGVFVVLVGGPTQDLPVDLLYSTAQRLLERGAAYVMCWGEGASRLEDIVDEAIAMSSLDRPGAATVMTTAHEGESIREVLDFATTVAIPAAPLDQLCEDVVLVFHGNVHWYTEAHKVLEDILSHGAA